MKRLQSPPDTHPGPSGLCTRRQGQGLGAWCSTCMQTPIGSGPIDFPPWVDREWRHRIRLHCFACPPIIGNVPDAIHAASGPTPTRRNLSRGASPVHLWSNRRWTRPQTPRHASFSPAFVSCSVSPRSCCGHWLSAPRQRGAVGESSLTRGWCRHRAGCRTLPPQRTPHPSHDRRVAAR